MIYWAAGGVRHMRWLLFAASIVSVLLTLGAGTHWK